MDLDIGRVWLAGAGLLVGAITGAWIWAQHAAAAAQRAVQSVDADDALIHAASQPGVPIAAALQGAFVGGILGLAVALAYFYFTNPDRGMVVHKVETGDDKY